MLILILLTLVACPAVGVTPSVSCNQTPERCGYPLLTPIWTLKSIPAIGAAQWANNLLVNKGVALGDSRLSQVAVNLDQKTQAWVWPETYDNNSSIIYKDIILYNSQNTSLKFLDLNGQLQKSFPLPVSGESQDVVGIGNSRFILVGRTLYIALYRHILAYDIDALVVAATAPVPLWSQKVASQDGGVLNIGIDETSGALYYTVRDTWSEGGEGTRLYALDRLNGNPRWNKTLLGEKLWASLIATPGKVLYSVSGEPRLTALDPEGKPLWTSERFVCPDGGTSTFGRLVVYGSQILAMPFGDHCFSAWDLDTGKRRWVFDSPRFATIDNPPTLVNGVLYTANTRLWAIEASDGKILGVSSQNLFEAQDVTGTVVYDPKRNLLYVWGDELNAFKPIR